MRVPLVTRMPETVPANTVNRDLIGFSDVLPILAAFVGAELPDAPLDGWSFAPQLHGEPGTPRAGLFSYYWPKPIQEPDEFSDRRFARTQNYKLYSDGRLDRVADDPRTTDPIALGAGDAEARRARRTLREALRSIPTEPQALMRPDSSTEE